MRHALVVGLLVWLGCGDGAPNPSARPVSRGAERASVEARGRYSSTRDALEETRAQLAKRLRAGDPGALDEARRALLAAFSRDIFPAWYGTAWEFSGTSQRPGEGNIACGYFVSTTLVHAGFRVPRAKLAQQAAETIIKTLVPKEEIWRSRTGEVSAVLAQLERRGDGLYLVGLDNHVGFLLKEGTRLEFCHSSYVAPREVTCEDAARAVALRSKYHVVGRLFTDAMLRRWLLEESFTVAAR